MMNWNKATEYAIKTVLIGIIIVLGMDLASAQTEPAVFLKNGSVIRGTILDPVQLETVRIQTHDGSIWVFDNVDVIEVGSIEKYKHKTVFSPDNTGFYNITDIGLLLGTYAGYTVGTASVQSISGYRLNQHWTLGLGIGLENFDVPLAPAFIDARYTLLKGRTSPFASVQGGYGIPMDNYKGNDGKRVNKGGVTLNASIGVKHHFTNHLGIILSAGLRHQQSVSTQQYWWFSEGDHAIVRNQYNRFVVRFGFLFS